MFPIFNRGIFLRFLFCRISTINRKSDLYNRGIFHFPLLNSSPISYSYFQNYEPNLFDILVKNLKYIQFSNRGIFLRSVIQQFPFARIKSPFSYDEMKNLVYYHFHLSINIHQNLMNVSNFQQRKFPLFSILYLHNQ